MDFLSFIYTTPLNKFVKRLFVCVDKSASDQLADGGLDTKKALYMTVGPAQFLPSNIELLY